jgi:hypothetical protein
MAAFPRFMSDHRTAHTPTLIFIMRGQDDELCLLPLHALRSLRPLLLLLCKRALIRVQDSSLIYRQSQSLSRSRRHYSASSSTGWGYRDIPYGDPRVLTGLTRPPDTLHADQSSQNRQAC